MKFVIKDKKDIPDHIEEFFDEQLRKCNDMLVDHFVENRISWELGYNIMLQVTSNFIGCFIVDILQNNQIKSKEEILTLIDQISICFKESLKSTIEYGKELNG